MALNPKESGTRALVVRDEDRAELEARNEAASDDHLISLWLHGRSPHTAKAYRADVERFRAFTGYRPLRACRLEDLQSFADSLEDLADTSRARILSGVRSVLAFGQRLGYLPFNVGAALKLPAVKNRLAERILSEADTTRMLNLEPSPRNRALLTLLYGAGLRVSEATGLRWRDLEPREDAGQVTVFGKGGKTRFVLLSAHTWALLEGIRGEDAGADALVFPSRRGGGELSSVQVERIVRAAAKRAGIEKPVSPHWLRHAHGSHALDRGAPIHLVQATLGHSSVATTGRYLHARPSESSSSYLAV
jgi:site-specific recombinase XerD